MKNIRKFISICVVCILIITLTSCRKINGGSSFSSGNVSELVWGTVEIQPEEENHTASTSSNTTPNDSGASSNTEASSSSQNEADSSKTTQKPTKPYNGNLPTIAVGKIPDYNTRKFEISGFWAPYEISEQSFKQYKDVGFTTLAMINHSLARTSECQFYLGSERTMKVLEICKKVGLKAILNYNDWMAEWATGDANYNGDTPFSKYDLYGDYKDIITGVHICDEPYVKHIDQYGNQTLINDFKKVYPNAKYIVNLIPYTAYISRGFESYDQMMEIYEKTFMEPFETPMVSVDVYPFHEGNNQDDGTLAMNYEYIAKSAKKYGVKPTFILQSSVGGGEFESALGENDLRWEINMALAFGSDTLQYYCYSVPKSFKADGVTVESNMYDYCILKQDNTPSPVYYHLQKLHKEIQSFSDVILAYDWNESIGVLGDGDFVGRVSNLVYDHDFNVKEFKDTKHYVSATASQELIISHFTNQKYGEAYMFVNCADRQENIVTAGFKDCKALAVYGNAGYSGTPKIINLDNDGNVQFNLSYGEAVFVTPLA